MLVVIVTDNGFAAEAIRRSFRGTSGVRVAGYVDGRRPCGAAVAEAAPGRGDRRRDDLVGQRGRPHLRGPRARCRACEDHRADGRARRRTGSATRSAPAPTPRSPRRCSRATLGLLVREIWARQRSTTPSPAAGATAAAPTRRTGSSLRASWRSSGSSPSGASNGLHRPRALGDRADGQVPPLERLPEARRREPHRSGRLRAHATGSPDRHPGRTAQRRRARCRSRPDHPCSTNSGTPMEGRIQHDEQHSARGLTSSATPGRRAGFRSEARGLTKARSWTASSPRRSPAPRTGDQEAVRFLYLQYADNVYGYVRSIVRDDFEAEDVTQHVFTKLMTALPQVRAARACRSPRGSCASPATSRSTTCAPAARSLARRSASSSRGTRAPTEEPSLTLREALATLPEDQREVIVLRHVVGLSPGEIAGRLGKTEPSIHGLHHRGRGALRAVLDRARLRADRPDQAPAGLRDGVPLLTRIPITRLDQADPELLEELLEVVSRVAQQGRLHHGRASSRPSRQSSPPIARPTTPSACPPAPRRSCSRCRALEIGPGDEVIVPTNSFIATAEAVSLAGATPRLVDVDPATHLITAEAVEAAIGPRTRAVIPVHLMGSTVDMAPLLEVARAAGLRVIEDCAQAHGARYRGQRVGTFGDIGCFSFYPTKNLGAWGDGGAVVTADERLAAPHPPPALARRGAALPPPDRRHDRPPRRAPGRAPAGEAAAARRRQRRRAADWARAYATASRAPAVELPAPACARGRPRLPPVHRADESP